MRLTFRRREQLASGIWQHYFQPERYFDFVPGQYTDITLPASPSAAETRTFTLTSLPGEELLWFVTKDFDPVSDYKNALHALQPGDTATCTDAMGDLVLPMDTNVPLVFVASGIAIASYASMLRQLAAGGDHRDISLLYAVRYRNQVIFQDIWQRPVVRAHKLFVSPQRLAVQDILAVAAPESTIYLSGSEHFVEDLRTQLLGSGIADYRIVFDFYEGYGEQQI